MKVKIIGKPAEVIVISRTNCLPKEVEIAGRPRVLSNISAILIPVEISGMNSDSRKLEQDIMVSDYLPENVTVLDEYSVSIKIVIEQLFKKIQIALSDITFGGLEDGYEAIPESDLSNIYIMVAGTASELKKLNTKTVNPYINCRGLDDGTYSIRLQCDVGDECEIISQPKVKVRIKKKFSDNKNDEENKVSATGKPKATSKPTPQPTQESTDTGDDDNDSGADEEN